MQRRDLLRVACAALAAVAVPAAGRAVPRLSLIKPARLRRGDLVGLIAPGGAIEDDRIETAVRNLESLGVRVKLGANIRLHRGNYAGTAAQQVDDLHAMFLDREVKAVWVGRGGSGGSALLPLVDYALIRRHAKVFVGFSDATALHLAIHRHAGLVTFHGPAGISTFSDYSVEHLRAVVMEPQPRHVIRGAEENRAIYQERTVRPGIAEGPLIGGNISVLTALVGTPYAAQMRGRIVFLEDTGEAPYRINRMLTQLVQSGDLPSAAGIMCGTCARCSVRPGEASLTLEEVMEDILYPLKVPSGYGYSIGHISRQFTIPLGIRARFDTEAATLTLLETAVR